MACVLDGPVVWDPGGTEGVVPEGPREWYPGIPDWERANQVAGLGDWDCQIGYGGSLGKQVI